MTLFRTFLFTPGNHARRVEKAVTLGADSVILDLEDAVAVSEKVATRARVVDVYGRPRQCRLLVRVNAMSTEWCYGDLNAVVQPGLDGILLPKVESASDVRAIDFILGALERERGIPAGTIDLMPLIETGKGFAALREIASSGVARVRRLAFGAGDFTLDMGIEWSVDETELLPYRCEFVVASRAAGLEKPIDTVWVRIKDTDGFARSAARARQLGFQGKLCIYPDQVSVTNDAFTPSAAEVAQSRRILEAFDAAEAAGSASIQLDGQFIDYPIVYRAREVLRLAEASDGELRKVEAA